MGKRELILDSSFLIVLTSSNLSEDLPLDALLSPYKILVPEAVSEELKTLSKGGSARAKSARVALEATKNYQIVESEKRNTDDILVELAQKRNAIVATLDSELIANLRAAEVPVLTLRRNRLVGLGTPV